MADTQAPGTASGFDERAGRLTLAIAALAAMATYLDTTILFVAFPDITQTFGDSSTSTLSWVLNGYTITFAALLVPAGKLGDRLGHRRAFLTGSALFTAASMAVGWASAQTAIVIVIGLALLAVFIAHQRSTDSPTLDLELFALGNFRWGNLAMLSFSTAFSALFFGLILFLVNVWDWSILKAGLGVAPGPFVAAALAPRLGSLAGQIGQRPLVIVGGLLWL